MSKRMPKRLVAISDMHCGHEYGLVPPGWQRTDVQQYFWEWFCKEAEAMGNFDTLVVNGDAIDGKGPKSGGIELITTDRLEQIAMAKECIRQFKAKKIVIIQGTSYHTGNEEPLEKILADKLHADFCTETNIILNGVVFNFKHHLGTSMVAHTRPTAITRAMVWKQLLQARKKQIKIDILIRSHVHYYVVSMDSVMTGIVTPCLQINSAYGSLRCEGDTDIGFVYFDIVDKNNWSFNPVLHTGELRPTNLIIR